MHDKMFSILSPLTAQLKILQKSIASLQILYFVLADNL